MQYTMSYNIFNIEILCYIKYVHILCKIKRIKDPIHLTLYQCLHLSGIVGTEENESERVNDQID